MKMRSFITTLGIILLISSLYFGHQYLDQQEVLTTTTTVQKEKIPADSSLYNAYYYPESTTGIVVQHSSRTTPNTNKQNGLLTDCTLRTYPKTVLSGPILR